MKDHATPGELVAREVRLYHRLQLAAHAMAKHADQRVKATAGLTTAQVSVLSVVAGEGPVPQRRIAQALGVNESAVTAMVRRLAAAGLVERGPHADDQRVVTVALTDRGADALQRARRAFRTVNELVGRALTADEIDRLAPTLDRLTVAFRSMSHPGGPPTP